MNKQVSIVSYSRWLPDEVVKNEAWPQRFVDRCLASDRTFNDIPISQDQRSADIIKPWLHIEKDPFLGATLRRRAPSEMSSGQAGAAAAQLALQHAGLKGSDIDLVLINSVSPDTPGPNAGPYVADAIGSAGRVYEIDTACASSITQLEVAKALIEAGVVKRALLVQVHLLLKVLPFEHPASPGIGDGAAAMVVTDSSFGLKVKATMARTYGQYSQAVQWIRDGGNVPWWKGSPHDFRLGSHQPEFVKSLMQETVNYAAESIQNVVRLGGVSTTDVNLLVSVQPRSYLPGCIAERLDMQRWNAVETYSLFAHVGNCGPVFNLVEAERDDRLLPGIHVIMYGQGAGFTTASALLEYR